MKLNLIIGHPRTYLIQSTVTYLSFATASKLFAATICYPYQLMRTRLQDQYQEYEGLLDVVKKTWK